jgi:hypothetical protein
MHSVREVAPQRQHRGTDVRRREENADRLPGADRVGEVLGAFHVDLDTDADIAGRLVLLDFDERGRREPGERRFHERTRRTGGDAIDRRRLAEGRPPHVDRHA